MSMSARLPLQILAAVMVASTAMWAAAVQPLQQPSTAPIEDLVLGTWVLNVAKSTYSPGPAPKSQTRVYEQHGQGIKASVHTVYADGHSTSIQYVAAYDSIEYPVTGSPASNGIALKKIDAFTAEVTIMHAGKAVGMARRVISRDGKTMTITYQGQWSDKPDSHNVAVYEKEGVAAVSSAIRAVPR
jgi:hypothetical protein